MYMYVNIYASYFKSSRFSTEFSEKTTIADPLVHMYVCYQGISNIKQIKGIQIETVEILTVSVTQRKNCSISS